MMRRGGGPSYDRGAGLDEFPAHKPMRGTALSGADSVSAPDRR